MYGPDIFFIDKFKIKSRIIKESEILSKDKINELGSSKRLLQHALITNSPYYLTGINSKNYLDVKIFNQNGIKNIIQNFEYTPFKKFQKSNVPLSIVHQIAMIGLRILIIY